MRVRPRRGSISTAGPTPALDIPGRYEDDQATQEFQLLFEGERVQGVAGLYYLDATAAGAFDTPVGALAFTIATSGEVKTESYAAFADVSFDLTDALSASLGVRWTHDERQGTVYRQNFTGLGSPLFGVHAGCRAWCAPTTRTRGPSKRSRRAPA